MSKPKKDTEPTSDAAALAHSMVPVENPPGETSEDWITHFVPDETPPKRHQFDPIVGDLICERIASGELLSKIEKEPGMASRRTVDRWILKSPEFAREYAIAQKLRCEAMLDQTIEIVDDEASVFIDTKSEDGTTRTFVKGGLDRAVARADRRERYIAKILPRTWGKDGLGLLVADPSAPALEPPRNGDTAKDMGNVIVLENHPLREEILAWQRVADQAKAR